MWRGLVKTQMAGPSFRVSDQHIWGREQVMLVQGPHFENPWLGIRESSGHYTVQEVVSAIKGVTFLRLMVQWPVALTALP